MQEEQEEAQKQGAGVSRVCLGLGSNLGDRVKYISQAFARLQEHPSMVCVARSDLYASAPMYVTDQPEFLNACLVCETTLADPEEVLRLCLEIEQEMGRVRIRDKGPRSIDIDVLFFEDVVCNTNALTLPHPLLHERAFVLIPLAQIAPDYIHPVLAQSVAHLAETCSGREEIHRTDIPWKDEHVVFEEE